MNGPLVVLMAQGMVQKVRSARIGGLGFARHKHRTVGRRLIYLVLGDENRRSPSGRQFSSITGVAQIGDLSLTRLGQRRDGAEAKGRIAPMNVRQGARRNLRQA